jgi:hypothetical protein
MKTADITDPTVCSAYVEAKRLSIFADAVLLERFPDYPPKVIYSAMDRAYRHGLIEYGVSLRAGWLTPQGLELTKDPTP